MRIVFITTKLNFVTSGASVEELDLKVREFMRRGHAVTVVTTFSKSNNIPEPLPYRVVEEHAGDNTQLDLQRHIYRLLKKYEPEADIFFIDGQVFLYGAGFYRFMGGKRPVCAHFNREQICWADNVSSLFGLPKKNIKRRVKESVRYFIEKYYFLPFANHIDAFSFTNSHLEQTYNRFGLKTRGRSHIAGDAFEYEQFMTKYGVTKDSYRARNKSNGPLTIYYSSRMAPGKGFDALVIAFSKLSHKENFTLVLGGKGPEDELVKQLVQQLGLEQYVTFTGWAPKSEHYARLRDECDIFVQPSQSGMDKTSYILLEAMAFGIPSVLPRGGGLEWDAKDSALYFEGGNTDDLARKIEALGGNKTLRDELSKKCYERLSEQEMDYHHQVGVWEAKMRELSEAHLTRSLFSSNFV